MPLSTSGRVKGGENVIYISLEEREDRIFMYMTQKGWDVTPYKGKALTIVKLDPSDFSLAINSIKNELPELVRQTGAKRVVIDPVSLFENIFDKDSERRREMFRFVEGIRDQNCTILMTSETDKDNPFTSRYNLIEYLADTGILLSMSGRQTYRCHLALRVKMRMSTHRER